MSSLAVTVAAMLLGVQVCSVSVTRVEHVALPLGGLLILSRRATPVTRAEAVVFVWDQFRREGSLVRRLETSRRQVSIRSELFIVALSCAVLPCLSSISRRTIVLVRVVDQQGVEGHLAGCCR